MFLVIDIGGTKTLLALFSRHGHLKKRQKFETSPSKEAFLATLEINLKSVLAEIPREKILETVVAIPGVVSFEQNSYSFKFGNLNWEDIDLFTPIKNLVNDHISFINDASLATFYEASRLNSSKKIIYLTFSTGIGGGLFKNNTLLSSSASFEPGHKSYSFEGKTLEWEDIASAKALSEAYSSRLDSLALTTPETTSDLVSRLSLGLIDIVKSEKPDVLIIGGPLAFLFKKLKKPLLSSLKSALPEEKLPSLHSAHRPTESVIYGGLLLAKTKTGV